MVFNYYGNALEASEELQLRRFLNQNHALLPKLLLYPIYAIAIRFAMHKDGHQI